MLHQIAILFAMISTVFSLHWTKHTPTGAIPTNVTGGAFHSNGVNTAWLISGHREMWTPDGTEITFVDTVSSYSKPTNSWSTVNVIGTRPPARAYPASAFSAADSTLYMYGGTTFDNSYGNIVLFSDLWKFNTATRRFTQIIPAGSGGPGPRAGAAMCKVGFNLYLFSGIASILDPFGLPIYSDEIWKFNLISRRWTQLPSGPGARQVPQQICGLATMSINGGEYFNPETFEFETPSDTWTFNTITDNWTNQTIVAGGNIPPRNYGGSFQFGLWWAIYGGEVEGSQSEGCGAPFGQNPQNDLWFFRPLQNRWEQIFPTGQAPPKLKRTFAANFGLDGYIFSGFDFTCPGPGQVYNNDVYVLSL